MRLIKRGQNYKLGMFGLVLSCVLFSSVNAQRLTALDTVTLANGDVELRYRFDKNIQPPKSFYMKDKNLLVLDFVSTGVNQTLNNKTINNNVMLDVQNLYANNKVRSTARLKPDASYTILNRNNEVVVTLSRGKNFTVDQPKWDNSVQSNIANLDVQQPVAKDVGFYRNSQGAGVVEVFLANDKTQVQLTDEQTRGVALSIPGNIWDAKQIRRIEVTDFATPVSALEVVNNNGTAMVRVRTQANYEFSTQQIGSKYQLIIKPKRVVVNDAKSRGLGVQEFTGDLISINFQDIDVRAILQIIADFTGLNIVVSDSVNSRITIRLQNVPWDQALDVVLRSKGLVQQRTGSVVYIVPKGEAIPQERDLITEVIQINNAKAVELAAVLKSTSGTGGELGRSTSAGLSQYGELTVDPNQNLLIVRDTPEQMRVVKELISHLDKPLRQVVIRAQIVVTTDNFSRELGVKWKSLGSNKMAIDHNSDGAKPIFKNFDAEYDFGGKNKGLMPGSLGSIWNQASGFNSEDGGSLGLAILRKGFNASLELTAMQNNNLGEVLASPTLMTTDRKEAFINEGSSIPYKTYADGATNTEFKDVVMELKVTPSITPDDNIIMDIHIKKDDVDSSTSVGEEPAIQKRELETQAIVRDGETVVLGGIYTVTSENRATKVPFLGDLPFVGNFFKHTENSNRKMEMVIFLTPNIVK